VELFAAIRFDWQRNQMPVRALARKYDVHRRTVRQAIASPVPPDRKTPERAATVPDGVRELIDGMLREDLAVPRKQRHTARRVFERLCDEHGARVSYSYVARYVQRRRGEIVAADRARAEGLAGFVPQVKEPGAEAEADFGDVTVCLAGEPARCCMLAFRLSCSGRACHRVYASQAQEAFLEGHVAAFEAIGGVRSGQIRYDNLPAAVARVLTGRNRTETGRWLPRPLWVRRVLLPPGPGRSTRERRRRGRDRPVPAPLVRPGAAGRVAGGAERPAGRGRCRRGRPSHRPARGHGR
jgi:hypothetical protein